MRRAAALLLALPLCVSTGEAQQVPGRDLLSFPLGTLADAPVLSREGFGIWNPALVELGSDVRGHAVVGAVELPEDVGASIIGAMASASLPRGVFVALSAVRGAVDGIAQTTTDPTAIGGDLAYSTSMYSLAAARRQQRVSVGVALRYRAGTVDADEGTGMRADAGVHADSLFGLPLRAGATTFLWQPASARDDQAAFAAGAEGDVYRPRLGGVVRAGYAVTIEPQLRSEHYGFVGGNLRGWDGMVGLARQKRFGEVEWSMRLGLAVRHSRYRVGLAREGMRDGIGGIYQFTLSMWVP